MSARFLRESRALPLSEGESELALAMADPTDSFTVNAFEMVTGRTVRPLVAIPTELEAALERLYGAGKSALGQIVGPTVTGWISDGPGGLARGLVASATALWLGAVLASRQHSLQRETS